MKKIQQRRGSIARPTKTDRLLGEKGSWNHKPMDEDMCSGRKGMQMRRRGWGVGQGREWNRILGLGFGNAAATKGRERALHAREIYLSFVYKVNLSSRTLQRAYLALVLLFFLKVSKVDYGVLLAWRRMKLPSGCSPSSTTRPSLKPSMPSRGPPTSSRPTRTLSLPASRPASSPPPASLFAPPFSPLRDLRYAEAMFRRVEVPTFFMYNTMIRAFSECRDQDCLEGVAYYIRMLWNGVIPDNFTRPFVLRSCSLSSELLIGRQVHGHVVKFGSGGDVYVVNNMLSVYSSCREMGDARQMFEECSRLVDVVSWTSLVTGYVKASDIDLARSYFDIMPWRNVVSWNAMISGYARSGRISDARNLFDMMPERDVSSWSAMISGYAQCKMCADALALFKEMVGRRIVPNEAAVVSAVSACMQLRAIELGTWLHEYIVENRFQMNAILGTVLVDMHGKCGNVEKAVEVFNLMPKRNVCSWNSMIASLALNAQGKQALSLFWKMQLAGHTPNHITFTAVLSGCSHSGLVEEGRQIFSLMTEKYQLEPWSEHYGSVVDLLGRAGLITEAVEFVKGMHIEPHAGLWGALVAACKIHGEIELGKQLGKHLIDLEPDHGGRYALLSDLFASVEQWNDVELVRNSFIQRKALKTPGNSIIEL